MGKPVAHKLLETHLVDGQMEPGAEIALRMDQALLQDATGTLVMLTLEALELERAATEVAVQYVDHNLLQEDSRNPEDHLFLESAARRFGLWFSPPGNGVSHPLHMARFGVPGKSLIGSDSHTPASGALGMLAFGAGGVDVAMAIAGEPYTITMPEIWGVHLTGSLPEGVSAKDIILEMLRRHGVSGGLKRIIEYTGPGLDNLTAMDRHVIANMGTELGATTTVFPSDETVKAFMVAHGREDEWVELLPDEEPDYDLEEEIDLSGLEPLIAKPSSPENVVPVRELASEPIYQAYIGSSANPGYRDFAVAARIVAGERIPPGVSLDINPTSRVVLSELSRNGHLVNLLAAGARLHQAGCNGCIGMGQAPATGRISLRTVPRNFPGRSGTVEDAVYLCSPETAAASALAGRITDPRTLGARAARTGIEDGLMAEPGMFAAPPPPEDAAQVELVKGSNIASLPSFSALPDELELPVLLVAPDDISTDEIMPAGAEVLPFRSNIPRIARFVFRDVDPDYPERADAVFHEGGHAVVGGENYGQGSSREHAALAPRSLGLRAVIARSFARIHRQNLINYGVLPLTLPDGQEAPSEGQILRFAGLRNAVTDGTTVRASIKDGPDIELTLEATRRERDMLLKGGVINRYRDQRAA
ncbi:aconitate hydratase [Roseibium salinum]|uniref:Aconitate hydratase n=2 Tax=Roseibium salinum TaxID=1604349 RepID=A0ABT3R460_9HYPH|nr:aconitate hydratase [Roseibium sp. DSM 29163]MCX2723947.1 aconitate hydratase [Roseibium sp. DSM 29163]